MPDVRVGIIGAGVMGAGHAGFIDGDVPGARVAALADVAVDRVRTIAEGLAGDVATYADPAELIRSAEIDALIIASPDEFHVEHVELALVRGIPVLCEKPIATDITDAREIARTIAIAEEAIGHPLVHYGFMRRFDPGYREMRRLVKTNQYGLPLFVRTITRNVSSGDVTTAGLFSNIAVHDFDTLRWMFSSDWAEVSSHRTRASRLSPEGLIDPLVFTARLKSGLLLAADIVAFDNYGYDVRAEVVCESGSIEMGIHGDVITRSERMAGELAGGAMEENWMPRFRDAYIAELRAWVGFVHSREADPDLATASDALAATEACALGIAAARRLA